MRKKSMILAGIIVVLSLSATGGCKKKDAVQGKNPPVHEKISPVKFSSIAPTNLPMVQAMPGGVGNVEWINDVMATDKTKVDMKNRLSIIGWVANAKDGGIPPTVIIQLNAASGNVSFYAPAARTKQKRPDVAKEMKIPAFENSAFQLDADISAVPKGTYLIGFLLSDGKYIVGFDTNRYLEIK